MPQSTRTRPPERIADVNSQGHGYFLTDDRQVSYGRGIAVLLDLEICLALDIPIDRVHWQVTSPNRVDDVTVYEAVEKRLHELLELPADAVVVYIDFVDCRWMSFIPSQNVEYTAAHVLVVSAEYPEIKVDESYPLCVSLRKVMQEYNDRRVETYELDNACQAKEAATTVPVEEATVT